MDTFLQTEVSLSTEECNEDFLIRLYFLSEAAVS